MCPRRGSQLPVGVEEKFRRALLSDPVPALEYSPGLQAVHSVTLPPFEVFPSEQGTQCVSSSSDPQGSPMIAADASPWAEEIHRQRIIALTAPTCATCRIEARPDVLSTPTRCIRAATDAARRIRRGFDARRRASSPGSSARTRCGWRARRKFQKKTVTFVLVRPDATFRRRRALSRTFEVSMSGIYS